MLDRDQDVSNADLLAMLAGTLLPSDIHKRRGERQLMRERNMKKGKLQDEYEAHYVRYSTEYLMRQFKTYRSGSQRGRSNYVEHEARYQALRKLLAQRPPYELKERTVAARKALALANRGCGKSKNR